MYSRNPIPRPSHVLLDCCCMPKLKYNVKSIKIKDFLLFYLFNTSHNKGKYYRKPLQRYCLSLCGISCSSHAVRKQN